MVSHDNSNCHHGPQLPHSHTLTNSHTHTHTPHSTATYCESRRRHCRGCRLSGCSAGLRRCHNRRRRDGVMGNKSNTKRQGGKFGVDAQAEAGRGGGQIAGVYAGFDIRVNRRRRLGGGAGSGGCGSRYDLWISKKRRGRQSLSPHKSPPTSSRVPSQTLD